MAWIPDLPERLLVFSAVLPLFIVVGTIRRRQSSHCPGRQGRLGRPGRVLGAVGGRPSRLVCAWIGVLGVVFALLTAPSVARACSAGMSWLGGYCRAGCGLLALVLGLAV